MYTDSSYAFTFSVEISWLSDFSLMPNSIIWCSLLHISDQRVSVVCRRYVSTKRTTILFTTVRLFTSPLFMHTYALTSKWITIRNLMNWKQSTLKFNYGKSTMFWRFKLVMLILKIVPETLQNVLFIQNVLWPFRFS